MPRTASDVAAQLFTAIESRSPSAVAALYDDAVGVWHNFDDAVQSKADNVKTLEGLTKAVEKIRYEVIERHQIGDRVIQRHNLHCTTREGKEITIPAAIFITVKNDKIVRIDEYLDTAQANALRTATGRPRI